MENEAAKNNTEEEEGPAFFVFFKGGKRGVGRGRREAAVFGEKGRGPVMLLEAWLGFLPFFSLFFLTSGKLSTVERRSNLHISLTRHTTTTCHKHPEGEEEKSFSPLNLSSLFFAGKIAVAAVSRKTEGFFPLSGNGTCCDFPADKNGAHTYTPQHYFRRLQ